MTVSYVYALTDKRKLLIPIMYDERGIYVGFNLAGVCMGFTDPDWIGGLIVSR
ncbi:hypothetical protein MU1_41450 [Paenibacillus glycanilyticus]|uniref:Uncharacterized protein n=1 Tax=Paenibacillus glycanilyticus TaxID=126569 RepID=A0ABQ6GFR4_9BACL|nr:hypothetical protein MU1_41450 [Paenibacillus glycanilyticus]